MGKKVAGQPEDDPYLEVRRDAAVEAREECADLVRQTVLAERCFEMHCEMLKWSARSRHAKYRALVDAGFSIDQAMTLLIHES